MSRIRVLVVASHPDDEVLGAGGTIDRRAADGHEVHILILAQGITSRPGALENTLQTQRDLTALHAKANEVAAFLGANQANLCHLPDNALDTVPLLHLAQLIERKITEVHPEIVYTQHGGDLNLDHVLTYRATLIATRPTAGCSVKEVYAYEVPSSTEWAFGMEPPFRPNTFVDISGEYLEKKIQAMEMYESERRAFPHPRSPEALRALAMWRGAQSGLMAAEAFQLVRSVR